MTAKPAIVPPLHLIAAASIVGGGFLIYSGRSIMWHAAAPATYRLLAYEIAFPPDVPAVQVTAALSAVISHSTAPLVLELLSSRRRIRYFLRVAEHQSSFVLGQVRAHVPELEITQASYPGDRDWSAVVEFQERAPHRLLRAEDPEIAARGIREAVRSDTEGDDALCLQWVIAAAPRVDVPSEPPEPWKTGMPVVDGFIKRLGPSKAEQAEAHAKSKQTNAHAVLRVAVRSTESWRAARMLGNVQRALQAVEGNGNRIEPLASAASITDGLSPGQRLAGGVGMAKWPMNLTVKELTGLIAWPLGKRPEPGIARATTRHMWPDESLPTSGIVLARSTVQGNPRPIALDAMDFMRHVHLPGKIGTGKSTQLLNMGVQLIHDPSRPSIILVDPHGDLAEAFLDCVPRERVRDVVYLNPADVDSPVGFNLMNGANASATTNYLMGVLIKLFGAGPQTSELLRNAIYTVALPGDLTLYEVAYALHDADFRSELTRDIRDEVLAGFWGNWNRKSERDQRAEIEPVMRRLGPLLTPEFRGIFGQARGIDIKELLDTGKILVVNLNEGMLGEGPSQLLGSLLVARIWQEVRRRAEVPEDQRHPVVMLADEFQRFMNLPNSFGDILAEARKFRLGLVLAHQLMAQITPILQDVMANTRNKIVLPLVAEDRLRMAREIGVEPEDIQRLGKHQVILSLTHDNHTAPPATGVALEPHCPKDLVG